MSATVLTDFVTPAGLANELGVCPRTLDRWNVLGEGPPRVKIGRRVLYRRSSVLEWLANREQVQGGAR